MLCEPDEKTDKSDYWWFTKDTAEVEERWVPDTTDIRAELAKTVGEVGTAEKHQQGSTCQPQQSSREAADPGKAVQQDALKHGSGKKEQVVAQHSGTNKVCFKSKSHT